MPRIKYDWPQIKEKYVTGSISLRELSKDTKVPQKSLNRHCSGEKWVAERIQYREQIARKTHEAAVDKEAEKRIDLLETAYVTGGIVQTALEKLGNRIRREGFGEDVDTLKTPKLLERLSGLVFSLDKIVRAISLLEGRPDGRVESTITLCELLGKPCEPEPQVD